MSDATISTETETTETYVPDTRPYAKKCSAIAFMEHLCYGYISDSTLSERYGYGVKFNDRAVGRFGLIAGWIVGLHESGQVEFARKAARDIDERLQFLGTFAKGDEMQHTDRGFVRCPTFKVAITDDGTLHGFSFCVYRAVPRTGSAPDNRNRDMDELTVVYKRDETGELRPVYDSLGYTERAFVDYQFAWNGAVIYHGPRRGESLEIDEYRNLWGIHT